MTTIPKRVVTVDAVIFDSNGALLLIERAHPPLGWALPGGVVEEDETIEEAIVRELQEETNALWPDDFELRLFRCFSAPGRDPRGPTISCAFFGVAPDRVHVRGGDDARQAQWVSDWERRELAFDHMEIARAAWAASGLKRGPVKTAEIITLETTVPLSHRQLQMLRDLMNGVGAGRPAKNPTLLVLEARGLVVLQDFHDGSGEVKPHWTITELGRAAISA